MIKKKFNKVVNKKNRLKQRFDTVSKIRREPLIEKLVHSPLQYLTNFFGFTKNSISIENGKKFVNTRAAFYKKIHKPIPINSLKWSWDLIEFKFNFLKNLGRQHPFHIVDPSPWPLTTAFGALGITFGSVLYFHEYNRGNFILVLGFLVLLSSMVFWWRDVIRESTFEGFHTTAVQQGLKIGVLLFIFSEVMFFFAFFWAFFHSSLAPTMEIGGVWPPYGIEPISAWGIPLLNTLLLLTSGAAVTWTHSAVRAGKYNESLIGLNHAIVYACLFLFCQYFEYIEAPFTMSDGIYGSTFYMATGFHGFHVLIGTIFLFVSGIRLSAHHFTRTHHIGLEAAIWYWHFVDVVWLFLFISIYWWGGK